MPPPNPRSSPHDAMLVEGRSASSPGGSHNGYFLGGQYVYAKHWTLPEHFEERRLSLIFEGVYGHTVVRVNGEELGRSRSGYTEFEVPLTQALDAGENLIEVLVNNSDLPNSRWYTGSGIYRKVWLCDQSGVRFTPDGVRFHTRSITGEKAVIDLVYEIENDIAAATDIRVEIAAGDLVVAGVEMSAG